MRRLSPLALPEKHGAVVPVAVLAELGVHRWRLYASDVPRSIHGVAAVPGVDPHAEATRIAAVRAILDEGEFLSRRTAARELGAPVRASPAVEVGAIHPRKPRRRPELAGHQVRPGVLRGQPGRPEWLPHPADVWGLLAPVCRIGELVQAGDFLISGKTRREPALCSLDELAETVQRFSGGTGVARLREALPLLRTGVESPAESALRLLIVRSGFPEPRVSCPVATAERTYHADLGYPRLMIAIEYDGSYHFTDGVNRARWDNSRIEAMIDAGWRVLRVTAADLQAPAPFLRRLRTAILQRGHP